MRQSSRPLRFTLSWCPVWGLLLAGLLTAPAAADEFDDALKAVAAVSANGDGHAAGARAMRVLNQAGPAQVPRLLQAMDGAGPIAVNWLRSAVNSAMRREGKFPETEVRAYLDDHQHHPLGRLLAFELLTRDDPQAREAMIPSLQDDPSLPLRFLAINRLIQEAKALQESDPAGFLGKLGLALKQARDVDQIQAIAKDLNSAGVAINLQRQLGFLNQWHLVASFDNKDGQGFDKVEGPEGAPGEVDLSAQYNDLDGNPTGWIRVTTDDAAGVVDLNDRIGKVKGATAYAYTEFRAAEAGPAQLRIGTPNATKIWLNGELVMSNEIYHNSNSIDKFIGDVQLSAGVNRILVKVCQNEQTEDWAQDWQFQLRICDSSGLAIQPRTAVTAE